MVVSVGGSVRCMNRLDNYDSMTNRFFMVWFNRNANSTEPCERGLNHGLKNLSAEVKC